MGTRSKTTWNDRCTRRGPLDGVELGRHLSVLGDLKGYARRTRREAKARVRHHARYIREHVRPEYRTPVQKNVLAIASLI